MTSKLSSSALKTIHDYLNLPFIGISGVRCPYFNNARARQRGQLKVLVGKGSPEEIVEEAKIISIQYRKDIFDKNGVFNAHVDHPAEHEQAECIRQFLVDNNLGIDCSGFVTNVLQKHFYETLNVALTRKLFITPKKNFLRWIISRLRPIEQISVSVYANDRNTMIINDLKMIQPADLIIMLKTGPNKNHNHILLITETDGDKIKYAHARAWSTEGKYGHGVSQGKITITNPENGLLKQVWEENGHPFLSRFSRIEDPRLRQSGPEEGLGVVGAGADNETYLEAKQAETLEIRRIKL